MSQPSVLRRRILQSTAAAGTFLTAGRLSTRGRASSRQQGDPPEELPPAEDPDVDRIAADPTDVPPPVDWNTPREHEITLRSEELVAEIEPGATFRYMTYEGRIPGPLIRVREGDTIDLTFEVPADLNRDAHNVDFHAVYGPGGGAADTTLAPGDAPARIRFRTVYPGIHIYHCAVPLMDYHVSSGMFGAILVEPADGLPAVDREFYLGQHELYTNGDPGVDGHHTFDFGGLGEEGPTYVVFNGEAYAFTDDGYGPLSAETDETVRVYFANGGPNLPCAWHAIGNVWSRLYRDGDLVSEPARYVETTPVAPGTTTAAEMELPVPGPITVVDHALTRPVRRGARGVIEVEGESDLGIYDPDP
ncbi:copper-containing nitrite reductase [Halorarum salinum]|uniref:Nitrite reductase, copper-containing n=1 Tax=Halorarum salinum TaxID=2743089 RepID=A0A7D5L8Y9_9EURY|nr:copper-containing nitrite reductase [Halobaculum salinum]QLG60495.1 nitrite reductase, copper-containing [Halobaculum salinum]